MDFTGVIAGSGGGLTLDAGYIVTRVANMLGRSDIDNEILQWLNMGLQELTDQVRFPELRTDAPVIPVVADTFEYSLPADFGNIDRVFYKATYSTPSWGRNLDPAPESSYGEPVDWQRLLNVDVGSRRKGDPQEYLIKYDKLLIDSSPLASGIPAELQVSYFRTPLDLIVVTDVPEINKRWRLYLIPITLAWGKIMTEKSSDQLPTIAFWEKKKEAIITKVKQLVQRTENKVLHTDSPDVSIGMEDADRVY